MSGLLGRSEAFEDADLPDEFALLPQVDGKTVIGAIWHYRD
jgi:hypothetical protein